MTIVASDFRYDVIGPALNVISAAGLIPVTKVAADLLMATAAQESLLGTYLDNDKTTLGVFQITEASLADLLGRLSPAESRVLATLACPALTPTQQIMGNMVYAAAVCRLFYWHVPDPLPPDTKSGLWGYYKLHYNTVLGAATEAQFMSALKLTDLGGLPA